MLYRSDLSNYKSLQKGLSVFFLCALLFHSVLILNTSSEPNIKESSEPVFPIVDSNATLRRPETLVKKFSLFEPVMSFDEANYHYDTSHGVFSWIQPLNIMKYVHRNETVLIKESFFVLQENSTGTWLSLLSFENVKAYAEDSSYTLRYDVMKRYRGQNYLIARAFLRMKFYYEATPKIILRCNLTDNWIELGLNHARWIWIVEPDEFKYFVNDELETCEDLTQLSEWTTLEISNRTYLTDSPNYELANIFLEFDWTDTKLHANVKGGREPFFNTRGIVIVFPVNELELDPYTVMNANDPAATEYETNRRVFQNPRGQEWYYSVVTSGTFLSTYKSENGSSWSMTTGFPSGQYRSGASWTYQEASDRLKIYLATSKNKDLVFHRTYILDTATSPYTPAAWDIFSSDSDNEYYHPDLTLDNNDDLWISYEHRHREHTPTSSNLDVNALDANKTGWTRSGVSPYLHNKDADIVYTKVDADQIGDFDFADIDLTDRILTNVNFHIWLRGLGDYDDECLVYLWNTTQWNLINTFVPDGTWRDYSQTVYGSPHFINTQAKINGAKIYLEYNKVGKASLVTADWSYLDVFYEDLDWIRHVKTVVTTNPDATPPVFSSPYTLWTGDSDTTAYSTIGNLSATHDVLIACGAYIDGLERLRVKETSYNGTAFSEGLNDTYYTSYRDIISLAVDSTNVVHICVIQSTYIRHYRWNVSVGWKSLLSPDYDSFYHDSLAVSIDKIASPEIIHLFYHGGSDLGLLKRRTHSVDSETWSDEITIEDDSTRLYRFSCSRWREDDYISLIYTRKASPYTVRFYGLNLAIVQYDVTFYFYSGCSQLLVNGTNTLNGTTNVYDSGDVLNLTAVGEFFYRFENYTYDASYSENNPFFLTVTQDYIVKVYFRFTILIILVTLTLLLGLFGFLGVFIIGKKRDI